jgi:hypothetical protein
VKSFQTTDSLIGSKRLVPGDLTIVRLAARRTKIVTEYKTKKQQDLWKYTQTNFRVKLVKPQEIHPVDCDEATIVAFQHKHQAAKLNKAKTTPG